MNDKYLWRICLVLGVLVFGLNGTGYSAIVADISNPEDSYSLAEVNQAGGIIVGDKLFDGFVVTTTTTANAIAPGADAIKVTGVLINEEFGLRFNTGISAWSVQQNEYADSTIKFHVSILDEYARLGWRIVDNSLWISAYGADNGGLVSVSENVYMQDPYGQYQDPPEPIADKFVWYINSDLKKLYDHQEFMDVTGAPLALTEIWVIKDVIANGGASTDPPGIAHLSEFFQTFSQIPEPSLIILLAVGGVPVMLRRKG